MKESFEKVKSKDPKAVYYLLIFLTDFAMSLIFVCYSLFLLSKGLDLFQISLVNLAFMLGNFIFEIPTGAYADYFGKRRSIIISSCLMTTSFAVYFFSSKFFLFVIAELISALGTTFISGALDAWIIDKLEDKNYSGRVDFVFSQANIISKFAGLIGGLLGAYLAAKNLALPFGLASIVSAITIFFSLFMVQADRSNINRKFALGFSKMGQIARDSVSFGLKHPVILWLVLSSALTMFAYMPLNMFWSPRLSQLAGNEVAILGWVWVGFAVFMMLGGYTVNHFLKKGKHYASILALMVLVLALPVLVLSFSNYFLIVLTGFLVHEFGRGMQRPVQKAYLSRYIPSEKRATILSFDSGIGKLGGAFGLVALGWVGKNHSIQLAWLISGIILLLTIFCFLQARKKEFMV